MKNYIWSDSLGRIELSLSKSDAKQGSHQGDCSYDIEMLYSLPRISKQFLKIPRQTKIDILAETGGWKRESLEESDFDELNQRILWIACGDIIDNPESYK